MAKRTFKTMTIAAGGSPQPLIGTKLTDVIVPSGSATQTISVADASLFQPGDWIRIGFSSQAAPNGAERVRVDAVNTGANTLSVVSLNKQHANGDPVALSVPVNSVYVQMVDGNTGAIYIGTEAMLTSVGGRVAGNAGVIAKIYQVAAASQPPEFKDGIPYGGNAVITSEYFIDGTTGDGYLPSLSID